MSLEGHVHAHEPCIGHEARDDALDVVVIDCPGVAFDERADGLEVVVRHCLRKDGVHIDSIPYCATTRMSIMGHANAVGAKAGGRKRLRTSHFELNESDPYQLRTNTERRAPNSDRQRSTARPIGISLHDRTSWDLCR